MSNDAKINSNLTKKITCEYCGRKIDANASICEFCKAPIKKSSADCVTCPKCKKIINLNVVLKKVSNQFYCPFCGEFITAEGLAQHSSYEPLTFDPIYNFNENEMVEEFIKRELNKAGIDLNTKLIPSKSKTRKIIFNILFSVLLFISVTSIFFHFPLLTYLIEIVILIVFFVVTRKYNFLKYLKKQLELRPKEKISNIIINTKNELVEDKTKRILLVGCILAIVLPLFIFYNPQILYEKTDNGYAIRYYLFGLTNFTTVDIPSEYNGEKVVSIRGNGFSNMFFLKKATLPDTITEIRGQAFKNDVLLAEVKLPANLEYLGGGAFSGCINLIEIALPKTLTYIGGESFQNAQKLKSITLPKGINEIRGNTFENCTSLESINIPDKVTRIGAHAFYGCTNLNNVDIGKNSSLKEIGSSAFRNCYSLEEIIIPNITLVNDRAFKNSPTYIKRYSSNNDEYIFQEEISLSFDHNFAWINNYKGEEEITIEHYSYSDENGYQYKIILSGAVYAEVTFDSENTYQKINDDLELVLRNKSNDYTSYQYLEVNYN